MKLIRIEAILTDYNQIICYGKLIGYADGDKNYDILFDYDGESL